MKFAFSAGCSLGMLVLAGATVGLQQLRNPKISDIRQFENVIYQEIQAGENWSVAPGNYVALRYVKGAGMNDLTARKTAALFDQCVEADCKALSLSLPESPIPVYFYPNAKDLNRAIGVNQNFIGGMSLGSWAVVISPARPSLAEIGATGAHVLGQALVHAQLGLYACPLFAEGVAYYLQGRYANSRWVGNPVPTEASSLVSLVDRARTPTDFVEGARFISYLIKLDHGNPSRFKTVMIGLNKARLDQIRLVGTGSWLDRVNQTFKSAYGKPLSAMEASWRAAYPA